jgi:hypothetical protein
MFANKEDYDYEKNFYCMVAVLDSCPDGEQHAVRRYQFCDSSGHGSSILTVSKVAAWIVPSLLIRGVVTKFREARYE